MLYLILSNKKIGGMILIKIQQIRNATVVIEYGGKRFLIDPLFGDQGVYPPFPSLRGDENNPLVELPELIESITKDVDMVIVTHTHLDHWDPKAAEVLDKDLPILVQNNYDAEVIREDGFNNVSILEDETQMENVTITKTPGMHYVDEDTKEYLDELTDVTETMGFIFSADEEETLYLMGDTIWYDKIEDVLDTYKPEVIVVNAGGNQFAMDSDDPDKGRLIINAAELYEVHKAAPVAKLFASHMEAINHWYTSRQDLKDIAKEHDFSEQLYVPEDGEAVEF